MAALSAVNIVAVRAKVDMAQLDAARWTNHMTIANRPEKASKLPLQIGYVRW
jgi:hypothetical protein